MKEELIKYYGTSLFKHYDLVPNGLGIVDLKGHFVYINKAFERQYGLKSALFEGKSVFDFSLSNHHKQFAKDYFAKMVSGKIKPGLIPEMGISWDYLKNRDAKAIGFIFIVNKNTQAEQKLKNKDNNLQNSQMGNLNQMKPIL